MKKMERGLHAMEATLEETDDDSDEHALSEKLPDASSAHHQVTLDSRRDSWMQPNQQLDPKKLSHMQP
ncbi:hypothetical protein U1Q18_008643 [Sarracenia purpurea var. burkii]